MRRALVLVVVLGLAGCGGGAKPPPSPPAATFAADPACGEVITTVGETTTKVQQELGKAASGTDADLENARRTVKQLYTDAAASVRSAVGRATNTELKSALESLATEATKAAASLDAQQRASTALALMDRTKVNSAVENIQRICGET